MTDKILLRNNVKVLGKGTKTIMFAHGFGCDQNVWRFVTPAFINDYKIVLFDYVGSGQSDLNAYQFDRYQTLKGYSQDMLDVHQALNLKDVILVSHSVSSMIGLLASIESPDSFEKVIMISPSPCYINHPTENYIGGFERKDVEELLDIMEKNYIDWANFLAPIAMKNEDQPALTQELTERFCSTDPVIANAFAKATFYTDNRSDLSKMTVPSLILQCTDDAIAPMEVGYYLHDHLPYSDLKLMQATGHCPHMSHPKETINLIKEYLGFC